jgi:predicted DNA-binding protein with PD1-like motif
MKYRFDGYNWLVRLERGELLIENLTKLVRDESITGAWITGLGASEWAELGFYDLNGKSYKWKKLDQLMEITSLQGNVSWESDRPAIHLHATLSNNEMQAFGGHVKELQVGGTCELLLHRWYEGRLNRSDDPDTGLNLLEI